MRRLASLLVLVALALAPHAFAQSQAINGAIEGSVHDATGALLPGVTVTITNLETGAKRTVQSGSSGAR